MSGDMGRVAWIAMAPVKAMALVQLSEARLEEDGLAGDRAFAVVDADLRLVNGKRVATLVTVRPAYDPANGRLTMWFPDGTEVTDRVHCGEPMDALFSGRLRSVRPVLGPWDEALSRRFETPLRLVAPVDAGNGADRGPSVSVLSVAALASLAHEGGRTSPLDGRRFRMNIGVSDVQAFAEDDWIERDIRIGDAVVRPVGNVGRCAVTTQDPDTGMPDFDTLRILGRIRGELPSTEPLPCGVWARVTRPGAVRIGDQVQVQVDVATTPTNRSSSG